MTPEQEQTISTLKALYESGAMDKVAYETAVSAITGTQFKAETESGTVVQGSGHTVVQERAVNVGGSVGGNIITGNVYYGPKTTDPAEAFRIYRQVMLNSNKKLPLRGIDVGASDPANKQQALGLANVYVDLNTTSQVHHLHATDLPSSGRATSTRKDKDSKPITALQKVIQNPCLVLTGDPGGGKSTFVNHLAHCLAAHQLAPEAGWLDRLSAWPNKLANLLPVVVVLRDFATMLPADLSKKATPNDLWAFIKSQLEKQNLDFVLDHLHERLEAGQTFLFLDGLDEVITPKARLFVRDAVMAFVERYPKNRYVVTCRILSYQPPEKEEEPSLLLPESKFPVAELAPFDEAQIDRFITTWYAELARVGTVRQVDQEGLVQRLKTAVRRPDLWRLAPNPLLLTVMALVHAHGRLPDSRALLYEKTVDMLLWRWDEVKVGGHEDAPPLRQLLLDVGRSEMDLKRLLWHLAFEAHSQTQSEAQVEAVTDISQYQLTEALKPLNQGDWNKVHKMVSAMKLRAGLLLERSPGVFTFPHRTFQEYLAGAHLSIQGDFSTQASTLAEEGALWREVILLAVGRLVHMVGESDKPYSLVQRLCPAKVVDSDVAWKKVWLAGDVLLEMGLKRVQADSLGNDLLQSVSKRLAMLLTQGKLTVRERMEVGDTLALLGDPRPGVITLEPELVPISAGPFLMGEEKHEIIIPHDYALARYPVTNAQYKFFIEDGGYTDKWEHCWTKAGWDWRESNNKTEPRYWQNDSFNRENQPVVSVNWYEAIAYVRWLAEKTGKPYRLPTEAEWERAARHNDGRLYPWGDTWQDNYANTEEAGLERTTAVGIFPQDTAVCGAKDMAGNVLEWCQTRWNNEEGESYNLPYAEDDGRENLEGGNSIKRLILGGTWALDKKWSRCGARYGVHPYHDFSHYGLRVMLSPLFDSDL